MATTPRKTFPELEALTAPVVGSDVVAVYRSPGPAKRTTASTLLSYIQSSVGFIADAVGAVTRTMQGKARDTVSVLDFMTTAQIADVQARTRTLDVSTPIQAAVTNALLNGKDVFFPAGDYLVGTQINVYASSYTGSFAKGLRFLGEGMLATTITSTIANGYIFDFDTTDPHTSNFRAILGVEVSNMSLVQSGSPAVSGGIRVQVCYHVLFQHVHVKDFTGTGIKVLCEFGDLDGSVFVKTKDVRIENCKVWGFDAAADSGFNEISYVSIEDTQVQNCGVDQARAITGITKANPAVVTAVAHGFTDGDSVYIAGVGGMVEADTRTSNTAYTVAGATTDTFQLSGINSTAFTTYTTGGHVLAANPQSGGIRWKGQVFYGKNVALTINENVAFYIPGQSGSGQDVTLQNFTTENSVRIGVQIGGVTNMKVSVAQNYINQATVSNRTAYFGWMLDGTSFTVADVEIEHLRARATSADTKFRQFQIIGANADANTIRVRDCYWQNFGAAGQSKFSSNFLFDPIPMQCVLRPDGAASISLQPSNDNPQGASCPYRLSYGNLGSVTDGEWVSRIVSDVTASNSGLAINTLYNVYLYDLLNVPTLEFSTAAVVADSPSGYPVKTGEPNKYFVGRIATDGSAQFVLTGGNYLAPTAVAGDYPGNPAWLWYSDADRKLRIRSSPAKPSSIADANYEYWPMFETSVAYDPPSLVAGATTTADVTVTCAETDYCTGAAFSTGWGGLTVTGCVKAANTVTLTLTNNTAGTINLSAGTLYIAVVRR
jgi:hypothetical protein